tara:strand:- start:3500 stop:4486 length:987 start_codon:yes stop_codon:yes gene_type:complete
MVMNTINPFGQTAGQPLAAQTSQQMLNVAANSQVPLSQLQQMAQAQNMMQDAAMQRHIEIPKVNFYPSNHPNPKKARRADIRQAYKLLAPTKRSILSPRRYWFGGKYAFTGDATRCVVDGCDIDELLRAAGNVYEMIKDEETGESLFDLYFKDPVTGAPQAFQARENVTSGRLLRGTYCPEHLHLYHLLTKWEKAEQEEESGSTSSLKNKLNKGVSMVTVPVAGFAMKDNTPPSLAPYEPFFNMVKQDNIPVVRLKNAAGQDEQVIVIFDMKQFQDGGNNRQLTDAQMSAPPAQMDLPGVSPSMGLSELLSQTAPPPIAEEPPAEATE